MRDAAHMLPLTNAVLFLLLYSPIKSAYSYRLYFTDQSWYATTVHKYIHIIKYYNNCVYRHCRVRHVFSTVRILYDIYILYRYNKGGTLENNIMIENTDIFQVFTIFRFFFFFLYKS